jgi:hypothetical protein
MEYTARQQHVSAFGRWNCITPAPRRATLAPSGTRRRSQRPAGTPGLGTRRTAQPGCEGRQLCGVDELVDGSDSHARAGTAVPQIDLHCREIELRDLSSTAATGFTSAIAKSSSFVSVSTSVLTNSSCNT